MHGVLRLILELNNETIIKIFPEIGYLHRGTEKLAEYSEYYKVLPYFDRFDYTGLILCEHAYILVVEKLLLNSNCLYTQIIRSMFNEIMRISSHLLALTTSAMDIGAITPFLWAFEEREEIANLFENLTGARIHTALYDKGGLNFVINNNDLSLVQTFIYRLKYKLHETFQLLGNSSLWFLRMSDVGIVPYNLVLTNGLSGPLARSTGFNGDMRCIYPYESFQFFSIPVTFGFKGDNLTRFFIRLEEIFSSLQYAEYMLYLLNTNTVTNIDLELDSSIDKMEKTIRNFKRYSEGYNIKDNKGYCSVESPKGEFGVSLVSSNRMMGRPYRLKVRSPGFYNLSSLNVVCSNLLLSDLLSYLSTLDLILGEVDR